MTVSGDTDERRDALDPTRSFIVEAPAGSGKTELLTQRLLKLLSLVDEPEQVLAITFTRKAAAEMRLRVFETLRLAGGSGTAESFRQSSRDLARAVLERSQSRGWSLIELGERLQIQTIDSLNARLARHLPVLTSGMAGAEVSDNAESLYRIAARRTTEALGDEDEPGHSLRQLLANADNSLSRLEDWLADVLPQRDRWFRLLASATYADLPDILEHRINRLVDAQIDRLRELAGDANEERLYDLFSQVRGAEAIKDAHAIWCDAAALLLTASGDWRKRFTSRDGIPAEAGDLRAELITLRERFSAIDGLKDALVALRLLPPEKLSDRQVCALRAFGPVLTRLLAELKLVFSERGTIDHAELALGALQALGAVDAPSDLLLALDRRIEHILVDEFQDTSHLQWEILTRLTAGWEQNDGRSLFLVGDPMQSIYRFRDADLSLFSKARQQGIGEIRLQHLQLRTNYRSAPELVDWANAAFVRLIPANGPSDTAALPFRSARASRPSEAEAGVSTHVLRNGQQVEENRCVVEIARQELGDCPDASIGILVRSRSHLLGMRKALEDAGLPVHAVEIDSLSDTQLGQDLLAFTSALLHPADRLAWLGLLRSPGCGIGWQDLHALCAGDFERTVPELLADDAALEPMSEDGRQRARCLREQLNIAHALRASRSAGRWLRASWLLMNPESDAVNSFFRQLDSLAQYGDIDDPAQLQTWFSRPDSTATPEASGIEVMTIHRAKGLEFDTVILPGLSRSSRGNKRSLLFIKDIYLPSGEHLNLAAVHTEPEDPLMTYLQQFDREQETAERTRLLYVAMTRARRRLHLIASVDATGSQPRTGSLLASLWPALGDLPEPAADDPTARVHDSRPTFIEMPLRRYTHVPDELPEVAVPPESPAATVRPEFEWVNPASIQVGTVIHRELCRLAQAAIAAGEPVPPVIDEQRYGRELLLLGVEDIDLPEAGQRVTEALNRVWNDPTGRWILAPHTEAWSELRITVRNGATLEHIRLDRSFVDAAGQRWIIDYKTGRHLGSDIDAFLAAEVERYREQLERYARAVAAFDPRPIRVGLYFPLMAQLRDWVPDVSEADQSKPV